MAVSDDTIRLILDMGQSGKDVQEVRVELDKLDATAKSTAKSLDALGQAGGQAAGQKAAGGRGILGASYAIQDFMSVLTMGGGIDRAVMSISNNVDQLAMSLGASAANAAKFSIAFTGFASVLPLVTPLIKAAWDALTGADGGGPGPVVEAIDAAEQKLKGLREELKKIKEMSVPEPEVESRKLVEEYLAQQGPGFMGKLAGAIAVSGRGAQMTEAERLATGPGAVEFRVKTAQESVAQAEANVQREKDRAQERINRANVEAAGKLMAGAVTDAGQRKTLAAITGARPEVFGREFAGGLAELGPEAIERQRAEDAAWQEKMAAAREATQKRVAGRKRGAQAVDKAEDALNRGLDRSENIAANFAERMARDDQESDRIRRETEEGEAAAARMGRFGLNVSGKRALEIERQRQRRAEQESIRQTEQATQAMEAQQAVLGMSGRLFDPQTALQIMKNLQRQIANDQEKFGQAMMEMNGGMAQQAAILHAQAQMADKMSRQAVQPMGQMGWR